MAPEASVIPIAGSHVLWNNFLSDTLRFTGRSLTRSIDASGLKLSEYARYIVALGELRDKEESNPVDALRHAGSILRHIHFSFLITGSSNLIFKISESTELSILSTRIPKGRLALVSGSLKEWKDVLTDCSKITSSEHKWVIETLLSFFFQIGLKHVFTNDAPLRLEG